MHLGGSGWVLKGLDPRKCSISIKSKDLGCLQTDKKEALPIGTQLIETSPDPFDLTVND